VTLIVGIFVASLLGSVHCAAMCGAFVCTYATPGAGHFRTDFSAHAAYHAGRFVSYVTLGAVAGAAGAGADRLGALAGIGRLATMIAGALLVGWALAAIATALGVRLGRWGSLTGRTIPDSLTRLLGGVLHRAPHATPVRRAATLGLVTTLIPCGWLYAFVATAAATSQPVLGAATMAFFWLGTVPALLAVGAGAARLIGPAARRLPVVTATVVLVMGLLAISGRVHPIAARATPQTTHGH
jgi:sulfite exporter TauE/SafE